MNALYFIIFGIAMFLLPLIAYKKHRAVVIYALAIGGVVNANFYHSGVHPIDILGLTFGIDSVVYTLFVFCVILWYIQQGEGAAISITVSSIAAIVIAAVLQLSADLMSDGSSATEWKTFATFMLSSLASVAGVAAMLLVFRFIRGKVSDYVLMAVGIAIVSFVNSNIYYPLAFVINGWEGSIWQTLTPSYIGKALSLVLSLGTLFIMKKLDGVGKAQDQ